MFKTNKITSVLLNNSSLKIEHKFGESTEIPLDTIHKVYLNSIKPALYIWVLYFIIAAFVSVIAYILIGTMVAFFIFITLLFFVNKMILNSNTYNLWVEFKDKHIYSITIPSSMKEEIKSLIWDIRTVLIKNK